ncbi:hypothetical protein AX774_g1280 [Zancudomyces culisetae]|uniref:Uncharacterized protein n=1 Tax=Zancudomyces culisetae TaxID=1213189 RepID=A0A1R1PW68_ZANCU|nr:hypothetical protein AX774_g1280 [Zancudomyces culisetae]|eukprot:OMH85179.1 hypothetical protein AX774_g1280 [Zancudomyces culisetae]
MVFTLDKFNNDTAISSMLSLSSSVSDTDFNSLMSIFFNPKFSATLKLPFNTIGHLPTTSASSCVLTSMFSAHSPSTLFSTQPTNISAFVAIRTTLFNNMLASLESK